jgi:Tfp pilus assembly protein PilN
MRALDLDFVPRRAPARVIAQLLCVGALLAAAWLAYTYQGLQAELHEAQSRLQWQQKRAHPPPAVPLSKEALARLQAELKMARQVGERLTVPWDNLFRELEASVGDQVTLLSIEPDREKRQLRITAEARNLPAMLEYERRLRELPSFQEAYVVSHQVQTADAQRPVRFVMSAQWRMLAPAKSAKPAGPAVETPVTMFGRDN